MGMLLDEWAKKKVGIGDALERAAKALVEWQSTAIHAGEAPDGSKQHERPESRYRRRQNKKGLPPLYKTGLLADASKWRVGKNADGVVWVRPPPGRDGTVIILNSQGYSTMFSPEMKAAVEKHIAETIMREGW